MAEHVCGWLVVKNEAQALALCLDCMPGLVAETATTRKKKATTMAEQHCSRRQVLSGVVGGSFGWLFAGRVASPAAVSQTRVRWCGRVPEPILPALLRQGGNLAWTEVEIRHTGPQLFAPEQLNDKEGIFRIVQIESEPEA